MMKLNLSTLLFCLLVSVTSFAEELPDEVISEPSEPSANTVIAETGIGHSSIDGGYATLALSYGGFDNGVDRLSGPSAVLRATSEGDLQLDEFMIVKGFKAPVSQAGKEEQDQTKLAGSYGVKRYAVDENQDEVHFILEGSTLIFAYWNKSQRLTVYGGPVFGFTSDFHKPNVGVKGLVGATGYITPVTWGRIEFEEWWQTGPLARTRMEATLQTRLTKHIDVGLRAEQRREGVEEFSLQFRLGY